MVTKGLLVRLESKDENQNELEAFLKSALPMARDEARTIAWFAVHFGGKEYGIFDVFADESGRQAHLGGPIAQALMTQGLALLGKPPQIQNVDIIASKLPSHGGRAPGTKAVLLTLKPKAEHEDRLVTFLREAQPWAVDEPETTSWFATRSEDGHICVFDTFPDQSGRLKHLSGRIARELAGHAFSLLGGLPHPELLDILAEKL
jgi:quinol monooxygenase YgiN